jgi:hypothetical protein
MKAKTITLLAIGVFIIFPLVTFLALPPCQAQAQNSDSELSETFSREELAQMLAPVALYPDALLAQVLMASTYPIEIIEADRWVRKNQELKDDSLDEALLDQNWDPSVKALCHFPSILALMSERIAQTTNIGNAFLAQEEEVLDMIQELRAKAYAKGNLATTSEQKVIVEKETIIIEPADPRVIYVPYYDPFYVYGPWWFPAYPPYYWGPSRISLGIGISYWPAFYFGFTFGSWSYFDWHNHYVHIDVHRRPRYVRHDYWPAKPGRWNHMPRHRRGVAYRDKSTARKYGQYPNRSRTFRPETRGFPDRGELDRERVRRTDDRSRVERGTREDTWTRINRATQEAQRVERDLKRRERVRIETETQQRLREMPGTQERARIEPERQEAQRVERDLKRREQVRIETETQQRLRMKPENQGRTKVRPELQERQRVEGNLQSQQRAAQERRTRDRAEFQQQQRNLNNVFNPFGDGWQERQSSERGRSSRQGPRPAPQSRGWSGSRNQDGDSSRNRSKR